MGVLIVGVLLVALSGKKIPLPSNLRFDLILVIGLGMAICTAGGINRVAALNSWTHPLAIVGYVLGAAILLIAGAVFLNIKLPFIANDQQSLVWIVALVGIKVLNTLLHGWLIN